MPILLAYFALLVISRRPTSNASCVGRLDSSSLCFQVTISLLAPAKFESSIYKTTSHIAVFSRLISVILK